MHKRIMALCALCLLCLWAGCALGENTKDPRTGVAITAPTDEMGMTPMYAQPDSQSEVLMRYFSGVQATVTRVLPGNWVQVQVGQEGASLLGYMRADELRYGAKAMREVPRFRMGVTLSGDTTVYAYCDAQAQALYVESEGFIFVVGQNDAGWVQIDEFFDLHTVYQVGNWQQPDHPETGFFLPDATDARSELTQQTTIIVPPCEGELTCEQAYDRAVELLLSGQTDPAGYFDRLPEDFQTLAGISRLRADARMIYDADTGKAWFEIYFEDERAIERNVRLTMTPQGEPIETSHGNG